MTAEKTFNILTLPGDGIGPEVVCEGIKVLKAVEERLNDTGKSIRFTVTEGLIGGAATDVAGVPLPEETLDKARQADAIYLGAVGGPKYDKLDPEIRPEQGLLQIRKALSLYANLRPVKAYPALNHASTLKPQVLDGVDLVVVRELTGGLYFGQPKNRDDKQAVDTLSYTAEEIERIARIAFDLAMKRRKKLCSVDKANVLATSQLWRDVVDAVAKDYPEVAVSHMYIDNAAMQLIRQPAQFDVMLTENTFGDILSDEASMLTGSLGMLPSASLGAQNHALYEACHGSAPDIAGQNKANPIAQILSLAMLLELSFGLSEAARWIEQAVETVLAQGYRTADIIESGDAVGTTQMGDLVVEALGAQTLQAPASVG